MLPLLLMILLVAAVGCAPAITEQAPEVVTEPAITQAEAESLFAGVEESSGGSLATALEQQEQVEAQVLGAFDLNAVVLDVLDQDVLHSVQAVDSQFPASPYLLKKRVPFYWWADEPARADVSALVSRVSAEEVFSTAWAEWASGNERSASGLGTASDIIYDAVMRPSFATDRQVTVEGTSALSVTFTAPLALEVDEDSAEGTCTISYIVEWRDDVWRVVAARTMADYAVAVISEESARSATKPSPEELAGVFGDSTVTWIGQDNKGRWWASSLYVINMQPIGRDEHYARCGFRDEYGEWHLGDIGAPDRRVQVDYRFPVPAEVIEGMRVAGVEVFVQE